MKYTLSPNLNKRVSLLREILVQSCFPSTLYHKSGKSTVAQSVWVLIVNVEPSAEITSLQNKLLLSSSGWAGFWFLHEATIEAKPADPPKDNNVTILKNVFWKT